MEVPVPRITTSIRFFYYIFICSIKVFHLSKGIKLRSNLICARTKRNSNSKAELFEDDLTLERVCPQNIHDLEILVGLAPLFSEVPFFFPLTFNPLACLLLTECHCNSSCKNSCLSLRDSP